MILNNERKPRILQLLFGSKISLLNLQTDLFLKYGERYWVEPSVGTVGIDLHDVDGNYLETFDDEREVRNALLT